MVLMLAPGMAPVLAQSSTPDSIKAVIKAQRAALAKADSLGNASAAFEARMHLATLTGTAEAATLLHQAGAIADSLDRPDLGAMASRVLAARQAATGKFSAAYTASVVADSLQVVSSKREAALAEDQQGRELRRAELERDSVLQATGVRERGMARAITALQREADNWKYSAIAALATGLLLVIGLLYRMGRTSGKLRSAIAELRVEVEALKVRAAKPVPKTEEAPASDAVQAADVAMQAVAADKFRKDGPERLATLQDARKRGDNDKVLRVVASLKPQLLGFDAERCAPLITRLRRPEAAADPVQWNADLDALEVAVRELMQ
jgi:hypothetical protein